MVLNAVSVLTAPSDVLFREIYCITFIFYNNLKRQIYHQIVKHDIVL